MNFVIVFIFFLTLFALLLIWLKFTSYLEKVTDSFELWIFVSAGVPMSVLLTLLYWIVTN